MKSDIINRNIWNAFKRFEDMGFMHHAKNIGIIQLDRDIVKNLSDDDIELLVASADRALEKYFE